MAACLPEHTLINQEDWDADEREWSQSVITHTHGQSPETVTAPLKRYSYPTGVKMSLIFAQIEEEGLLKWWLLTSGIQSNVAALTAFCCLAGMSSATHEGQPSSACVPPACSVARGSRRCLPAWALLWVWWFLLHQGFQRCWILRSRNKVIWVGWGEFFHGEQRSQLQHLSLCWRWWLYSKDAASDHLQVMELITQR